MLAGLSRSRLDYLELRPMELGDQRSKFICGYLSQRSFQRIYVFLAQSVPGVKLRRNGVKLRRNGRSAIMCVTQMWHTHHAESPTAELCVISLYLTIQDIHQIKRVFP